MGVDRSGINVEPDFALRSLRGVLLGIKIIMVEVLKIQRK